MALFNFDYKEAPLASPATFAGRMLVNVIFATVLIAVVLGIGIYGYQATEGMSLIDAFLNSAMLLGGMGPVDAMKTDAGKVFAGSYALLCGLVIVAATAILLAPVMHRVMHAVHVDDDDK